MGDNGQTILRCLTEVDNSRPYFVGFLAQRYGWHQETDEADASLTNTFKVAEAFPQYLERIIKQLMYSIYFHFDLFVYLSGSRTTEQGL